MGFNCGFERSREIISVAVISEFTDLYNAK
jgi:hypothetical protein